MIVRAPVRLVIDEDRFRLDDNHLAVAPEDLRVVLFGLGLSGKSTNLLALDRCFNQQEDPGVHRLEAPEEQTIVYDAVTFRHEGKRVHALTLSGAVHNRAAWLILLRDAHGLVFVVDSQRERLDANIEKMAELDSVLTELDPSAPRAAVIQYNKRDLPNAASHAELSASLNERALPEFEAIATRNHGVSETMLALLKKIEVGGATTPNVAENTGPQRRPWWKLWRR